MRPSGYHDEAAFFEVVWRFSAFPIESWEVTMDRLEEAISRDCKKLGAKEEMTPQRVTYAYRHHRALGQVKDVAMRDWRRRMESRNDLPADHPVVIGEPANPVSWPTEEESGFRMKMMARDLVFNGEITTHEQNEKRYRGMAGWLNEIEREIGPSDMLEVGQREALQLYRSIRKLLKEIENK